jgi:hypothetical protein
MGALPVSSGLNGNIGSSPSRWQLIRLIRLWRGAQSPRVALVHVASSQAAAASTNTE